MVTVAEEIPFAAVPVDNSLASICSFCFKVEGSIESAKVSRCIGCHVVSYCSRDCQKKDWINHKHECRLLKNCSPYIPDDISRLIARVIFKLEREDAHNAAFNGRRFEDIGDHRNDILEDPERLGEFARIFHSLRTFMGERHVPKRDVLLSIFGKVVPNLFEIGEPNPIGAIGLYIGLSGQQHSCDPDAYVLFSGNKAILRSSRLNEYSQDVTITYTDLLLTSGLRQNKLRSKYYFTCHCSVCSDPTKDFLCNSARSTCCPDSYCLLDPNATELSCFKCGRPSKIRVDEAISANQEVSIVYEEVEQAIVSKIQITDSLLTVKSGLVQSGVFQQLIQIHEEFSKVLSRYNVNLLRVTDILYDVAFTIKDHAICLNHAPNIILAYKRYLSIGNPVLSNKLICLSLQAVESVPRPTRKVVELLEETVATAITTYDPRHPHIRTAELEERLVLGRMALLMDIL